MAGKPRTKVREDIPSYCIKVRYDEKSLSVKQKREGLTAVTRYHYMYPGESLDEKMSMLWKAGATAEIHRLTHEVDGELKATDTKGIWA